MTGELNIDYGADARKPGDQEWSDGGGVLRSAPETKADDEASLILDLDGFEGPLDLLLTLAREQKVDIAKISVLALAEQYLVFIDEARHIRLELAADYLVMAAWLAYLKSRLLIPNLEPDDELPAEELASRLAFRLQRLQAMRDAASQFMARNRLGRDVFARGAPEAIVVDRKTEYANNLYDLLQSYVERRQKDMAHSSYKVVARRVWTVKDAQKVLERLIGQFTGWGQFGDYLAEYTAMPEERPGILATCFSACLEMVREGALEIRQDRAFEPLFLRTIASGDSDPKEENNR